MHLFSNPWKYQKTWCFQWVDRKSALGTNGLIFCNRYHNSNSIYLKKNQVTSTSRETIRKWFQIVSKGIEVYITLICLTSEAKLGDKPLGDRNNISHTYHKKTSIGSYFRPNEHPVIGHPQSKQRSNFSSKVIGKKIAEVEAKAATTLTLPVKFLTVKNIHWWKILRPCRILLILPYKFNFFVHVSDHHVDTLRIDVVSKQYQDILLIIE